MLLLYYGMVCGWVEKKAKLFGRIIGFCGISLQTNLNFNHQPSTLKPSTPQPSTLNLSATQPSPQPEPLPSDPIPRHQPNPSGEYPIRHHIQPQTEGIAIPKTIVVQSNPKTSTKPRPISVNMMSTCNVIGYIVVCSYPELSSRVKPPSKFPTRGLPTLLAHPLFCSSPPCPSSQPPTLAHYTPPLSNPDPISPGPVGLPLWQFQTALHRPRRHSNRHQTPNWPLRAILPMDPAITN